LIFEFCFSVGIRFILLFYFCSVILPFDFCALIFPGLPRLGPFAALGVSAHRNDTLRGNPKLKALNSKQNQKSKIKNQNDKLKCKNLPHFAF